jgi:hypothetical protein
MKLFSHFIVNIFSIFYDFLKFNLHFKVNINFFLKN